MYQYGYLFNKRSDLLVKRKNYTPNNTET